MRDQPSPSSRRAPLLAVPLSLLVALLVASCGPTPPDTTPGPGYEAEIRDWQQRREASLASEDGWLTLVGLHWLEEGANTFGSEPGVDLLLTGGELAGRAGVLRLADGAVTLEPAEGAGLSRDGEPLTGPLELAPDTSGEPTVVESASLSFHVIERDGRLGVRVKDSESPVRLGFDGIERFPVDPAWRVAVRFEPFDRPREMEIPNVLGSPTLERVPGELVLELDGTEHRLHPMQPEPGEDLFLVFGDATNGSESYGGGRFLYAPPPGEDGWVILDFNRAYNPPCVFTPYATCPLPPPQNRLPVRVEAGEKMWGEKH